VNPVVLITYLDRTLTWPALYGAIFLGVALCLLVTATVVALFARDDKRANRAMKIFTELLRLFDRRSP
jgi:hypothetical protein